ncbi:hypothetical protein EC54115_19813, partial [Escherichia coli 541-15]
ELGSGKETLGRFSLSLGTRKGVLEFSKTPFYGVFQTKYPKFELSPRLGPN